MTIAAIFERWAAGDRRGAVLALIARLTRLRGSATCAARSRRATLMRCVIVRADRVDIVAPGGDA